MARVISVQRQYTSDAALYRAVYPSRLSEAGTDAAGRSPLAANPQSAYYSSFQLIGGPSVTCKLEFLCIGIEGDVHLCGHLLLQATLDLISYLGFSPGRLLAVRLAQSLETDNRDAMLRVTLS